MQTFRHDDATTTMDEWKQLKVMAREKNKICKHQRGYTTLNTVAELNEI